MNKKICVLFLACCFGLGACSVQEDSGTENSVTPADAAGEITEKDYGAQTVPDVEAGINDIDKYGNITLTISPDSMLNAGYETADIISVRIGDSEMEMPVGTAYSDADSGEPICCFRTNSLGVECVTFAVNTGNMAQTMGIAERHVIDTDPGFEWIYLNGLDESVTVYISMVQKQGYADEYRLHQLGNTRTNKRDDYASLSDAEFANFRVIETTGMGKGTLYRSSSPVNPALNRNQEADDALLTAGIRTVLNMSDSESLMKQYPEYIMTSYSHCDIIALNMEMNYYAEDFQSKLAEGFRYIISHDGPYLIHCNEGKDRTGFAAALLECLMGADVKEIQEDYMLTYFNFYGIEPGTVQYDEISSSNIEKAMARAFNIESIRQKDTDLQACAEAYLNDIGMSPEEISALKARLAQEYEGKY